MRSGLTRGQLGIGVVTEEGATVRVFGVCWNEKSRHDCGHVGIVLSSLGRIVTGDAL
jgi:hypothetical protein